MEPTMKKCPFCGEEIKVEARKCRYCGKWLNEEKSCSCDCNKNICNCNEQELNSEETMDSQILETKEREGKNSLGRGVETNAVQNTNQDKVDPQDPLDDVKSHRLVKVVSIVIISLVFVLLIIMLVIKPKLQKNDELKEQIQRQEKTIQDYDNTIRDNKERIEKMHKDVAYYQKIIINGTKNENNNN